MDKVYYELANRRVLGSERRPRHRIVGEVSQKESGGQAKTAAGNHMSEYMEAVCIEKYHKLVRNEYVCALVKAVVHDAQSETRTVMKSLAKVKKCKGFKTARHDVAGFLGYLYYSRGCDFDPTWWFEMESRIYRLICVSAFLEGDTTHPSPNSVFLFDKITTFRTSDDLQISLSKKFAEMSEGFPNFIIYRQKGRSWWIWITTMVLLFVIFLFLLGIPFEIPHL